MKEKIINIYQIIFVLFVLCIQNLNAQNTSNERKANLITKSQSKIVLSDSAKKHIENLDEQNEVAEYAIISHSDFMKSFDVKSERIELRDKNSRHFKNPDGTLTAVIASGSSMNYLKDKQWIPIETNIVEKKENSADKRFENSENQFVTYYPEKSGAGNTTVFKEGKLQSWINPSIGFLNEKGETIKSVAATNVKGMPVNSSLYYRNIFSYTDARFTQGTDGNKLDYIIQSEKFLELIPIDAKYLVFYEEYQIPENWIAQPISAINRYKEEIIANILFTTNEKIDILKLNRPIYHEQISATKKDKGIVEGSYDFIIDGTKIKIGTKIPVDWLRSDLRTFPVIIDPTADCYPNNTSWWTGHTEREDDSPNYTFSTNDNIMVGWYDYTWPTSNGRINGWAKYNISSISTTAVILNSTIKLTAYDYFGGTTIYFCPYGNNSADPVSRTASQRYSDVAGATSYNSRFFNSTGSFSISGNTTMNNHIQAKLSSGWYAMGMYAANSGTGGSWGDDSYYTTFRGYSASGTSRPYLTIQYCQYQPTANAGTNKTICNTSSSTMTADVLLAGETGVWTIVSGCSGCSFSNTTSPTAVVSNIPQGTSVLRWTVTLTDGGCSSSATVSITNNTPTTPNAGGDITTCNGTYQLNGNNPTYGSGTWSIVSGSGVFSPNNTTYNATVNDLSLGSNTFRWTITNNGCSLSDDVTITYNALPTATISSPASSPHDICVDFYNNLTANNPAPASGAWSAVSGSGSFSASTSNVTNVNNLSPGENILRWTVTATGIGCVNQANVTFRNNAPTTANAGPAQMISGSSATLTGNSPSQGTGQWSFVSAVPADPDGIIWSPLGPPSGQNIVTVSSLEQETLYTFLWTVSHSSCPNSTSSTTVFWDPGVVGLVIQSNLTNDGHFNQTEDTSYFFMTGTDKYIYGSDANNRYTATKLKARGSITFDGAINNGKFAKTYVTPTSSFLINTEKIYKNDYLFNSGTISMNASSSWENSGDWTNANIINADATSTVVFNGDDLQTVITNTDVSHTTNLFGNVVINNSAVPNSNSGVKLATNNFVLKNTSSITFTDGALITNGRRIIVNNPASTGIILGPGNTTGTESWVYATSDASTLRKYMNDDSETYHFPVGAATHGNLATIKNNNLPNGTFYLDTWFKANPTNVNTGFPDSIVENATRYAQVAPEGVWVFNPNGTIDGTYDLSLYYNQFATASWSDNYFSILSRPNDPGNGTTWQLPPTNSIFQALSLGSGYAYRTGLNSFSEKGVGVLINNLPVELLSFYAHCLDGYPLIKWSTAAEINNSHFIIEKSYDAQNFFAIAIMEGAGNSNSLLNYEYHDKLNDNTSYYRLKQFDFDGSVTIYDPIVVNCDQQEIWLKVYPNPFKEYVIVSSNKNAALSLTLTDSSGKLIQRETTNFDGHYQIDLQDLGRGVYVLILQFENEEPKHFKLVKN